MDQKRPDEQQEAGIEIPFTRIDPTTMQRMIEEFVTRDGTDLGEVGCSLEDKVRQVQQQLQDGRVRIVFDLTTQTANFVPRR